MKNQKLHSYIVFYKPYRTLSQFGGAAGQRTLAAFGLPPAVYAAGRLDYDSEGLLLLTNDGQLIHALLDPANEHPRTYLVQVERIPAEADLEKLRNGIFIGGEKTKPCHARLLSAAPAAPPRDPPIRYRKNVPTAWLEITLREGRNRQVRRMTATAGYPTLRLIRIALGPLRLGILKPGAWRRATENEIRLLKILQRCTNTGGVRAHRRGA